VFIGYGDDHRSSDHAVLASKHVVREAPDPSSPTSGTPFSLAALLALASSRAGLAEVSILNVLAMLVSRQFQATIRLR
jgi:hypothetical protein